MANIKKLVPVITFMLVFSAVAQAEVITIFDSNATIASGNSYDTTVVKGNGTVVNMTGGTVNKLITMNASTFNMSGGSISNEVQSYDSSVLNLSSGNIGKLKCYAESRSNISGNAVITDIYTYGLSVSTISGNATITTLYCRENSKARITGGSINLISLLFSQASVRISGGTVAKMEKREESEFSAKIEIVGYNLAKVPYGGTYGKGQVSGNWNNDTPFVLPFNDNSFFSLKNLYAYTVLFDGVIPPECVSQPSSDLNGDCKVNFADFAGMSSEWLDCGLDPNDTCFP